MNIFADIMADEYAALSNATPDQKAIYRYGVGLLLDDIISFSLVIALGVALDAITFSLVFLPVFCVVRRFSGGFHANTKSLCRAVITLTFLLVYIGSRHIANGSAALVLDMLSLAAIAAFAPAAHANKPLTENSIKRNKRRAMIATMLFAFLSALLTHFGRIEGTVISLTLSAVAVLLFISVANNHKRQKENKNVAKSVENFG